MAINYGYNSKLFVDSMYAIKQVICEFKKVTKKFFDLNVYIRYDLNQVHFIQQNG